MSPGPRNNSLDLGDRFQPTGKYRTPPPACLAALQKKEERGKKKEIKRESKKSIFQIEFNSAPFGILTEFSVSFPC
ncbi:hypothetical protein EO93_12890 [Methanosarcina sp. 1.H.A.2.2]|nr:hypothetical protein EO93_12890 [Methanosarcina sp. 1.H.A.2.2]